MIERERKFSNQELVKPAEELATCFVQRWDLHARQTRDGRYLCIHKQLTDKHIFAHLRGQVTLGTYVLDQDSQARYLVFDADDETTMGKLWDMGKELSRDDIPAYLEQSRRGGHLWMFFEQPISGKKARNFARNLLEDHKIGEIEVFPKQDKLASGPGSLIRLPFGVHRLSGKRYVFYTPDGEPIAPSIRAQIHALSAPQTVPNAALDAYQTSYPSKPITPSPKRSGEVTGTLSERIKAQSTVLEFVSQFVDLKLAGNGAVGLCPFHDDHNPSFGINDEENYWHCFAGCGGGSIIDFWSKWREKQELDSGFTATVTDLADMLFS